ncbi:MAG: tetratricopeptide repeat protein, partial [Chloroflexi bacterium]|nr:tetratricopeptide repeat protein [Chloroflexota bacterium]
SPLAVGFPDLSEVASQDYGLASLPQQLRSLLSGSDEEDVVSAFLDSWSQGDFEAAYDMLASDSPIRDGQSQAEWAERRRHWSAQARPENLKLTFMQERDEESEEGPVSIEIGWSLAYTETALDNTLKELPTATVAYAETRRHWFWASYTFIEEDDDLLIHSITDEGVTTQNLPSEELEKRMQEVAELAAARLQEVEAQVGRLEEEEDEEEFEEEDEDEEEEFEEDEDEEEDLDDLEFTGMVHQVEEAIRITTLAMHYNDVYIAQSPPGDPAAYQSAYDEAQAIEDHERAAAYAQLLAERFPEQRGDALRKLSLALFSISEAYAEQDDEEQTTHFLTLAEQALRDSIAIDQAPFGYIMLAQTLIAQNKQIDEAESLLHQVQASHLEPKEETLVEEGLAKIARLQGENTEALRHYQRAAEISPDFPGVWFSIGSLQRELNQIDEAEQSFLRSLEMNPEQIEAYSELALIYAEVQRDLTKAQDILEQGLEIAPDSAELLAILAMVLMQQGDLRTAGELLDEAEEIDPELEVVQKVRETYNTLKLALRPPSKHKAKHHKTKKK